MKFIRNEERERVHAVAALADCNPFSPERIELERRALGEAFAEPAADAPFSDTVPPDGGNAARLHELAEQLAAALHQRLAAGATATAAELGEYHGLVLYLL